MNSTCATGGVFHGRLASLALRFTTKCLPICFGPRRRALGGSTSDDTTSHAVSIRRSAYLSPYDRAVYMIERLLRLPSIATYLYPILVDENIKSTGHYKDPTSPLKTLFDHGYTLNMLLNELESPFVSTIDLYELVDESGYEQHQLELFWRGCVSAGLAAPEVLGSLQEAEWGGGFELALATVAAILDILQERGRLGSPDPRYIKPRSIYPAARAPHGSPRHTVLATELAQTEVAYMQDLEQLAGYAKSVRAQLDCDSSDIDTSAIFGHIDQLLALHRKFSMRIQYLAAMPTNQQFFDVIYTDLLPEFDVYSSFCASRDHAQRAYNMALPVLKQINCGVDPVFDVPSLFMRPVQRLAQYPLLFQSIVDELCNSCAFLSQEDQAKRVLVIKSMYTAMRFSKRILSRANEAARETTNQACCTDFFERVDSSQAAEFSEASMGRLMTSGRVSAKSSKEYEDLEAYLFANSLVLCKATDPVQSSRSARFLRTLSSIHMTIKSSSPLHTKLEDRRRSGSSVSSSTLHTRCPTPDDSAEFQLPTIDTNGSPSLISPPIKLLSSYASLVSLRDKPPPVIKFTSTVDVTIRESECTAQSKHRMSRLRARERYPTGAISQISQAHELSGTVRLTIQVMMASGAERVLVFRRLTQESASIWVRMLKRTVPLVPVEGENAAQNAYHCLLVNPRFAKPVLAV